MCNLPANYPSPIYRFATFPGHGQQSGPNQTGNKLVQRVTAEINGVAKLKAIHPHRASSSDQRQYPLGLWSKMPPSLGENCKSGRTRNLLVGE